MANLSLSQLDMVIYHHPNERIQELWIEGGVEAGFSRDKWKGAWNKYANIGTWTPGDFLFRVRKQIVRWGETDGFRLMDQINPLDQRRGFLGMNAGFALEFESCRFSVRP
jgi:hypothetical protein